MVPTVFTEGTGGESSERNAGGDSSDQGTLGCLAKGDSSDQGTQGMSKINVIFLTNLENWPISLNIQLLTLHVCLNSRASVICTTCILSCRQSLS